MVIDPQKDSHNYVKLNNPKARSIVLDTVNDLDLIDIYRTLNPQTKRYTWRRKNPLKQSRLHLFLMSNSMCDLISKCEIQSSYRLDHSVLELNISLHNFKVGKGIWKFNNSLLKNKDYLDTINMCIEEEKMKYAVPIYNLDYLMNNQDTIELIIEKDMFLEMLFMRIRGETIKFATTLKKENKIREKILLEDIDHLERIQDETGTNSKLMEDKKLELQKLREKRINGQMVRSHLQWLDQGEKPTNFFCKLETKNFVDKTIKKYKQQTVLL